MSKLFTNIFLLKIMKMFFSIDKMYNNKARFLKYLLYCDF